MFWHGTTTGACGVGSAQASHTLTTSNSIARLTLGHVDPFAHGGATGPDALVTECSRCNETAQTLTVTRPSMDQVWDRLSGLGRVEKRRVLTWLEQGHRDFRPEERSYMEARQLPGAQRQELARRLSELLDQ